MTQACASCGTQVYEFGFCSHCGAPLCASCIRKHELLFELGAGHVSIPIPIPIRGFAARALRSGFGYHKIDTLDFPFPHCPACIGAHARMRKMIMGISLAVGGFFFGLILWGMLAGSGYAWGNAGIYSVLASILGGITGIIMYLLIRGLQYRQEVIRCPRCGQNIQDAFVSQGLSGHAITPYGSETISMQSVTYMAGLRTDTESQEIADKVLCPYCGYEGPLRERMGLHKFVRRNGVATLRNTMWENIARGY